MTEFADLEISLQRRDQGSFQARLSFRPPGSDARRGIPPQELRFDREALNALSTNPAAYGQTLAKQLFAADQARTFFAEARVTAASHDVPLRVRLQIEPQAHRLHELRWETLGDPDPETDGFLCTSERLLFSRYISSSDRRLVAARPREDLKALVVIANPSDIAGWQDEKGIRLAPVPVADELARVRKALGAIPVTALCSEPALKPAGRPTLKEMLSHLRDGCDVLYLVAHGAFSQSGQPLLWLEDEQGKADRIVATDTTTPGGGVELGLLSQLAGLSRLPRLVILASCESAGDGGEEAEPASRDTPALAALGPRLAEIGVPAVVAMQGRVTMKTVEQFMPALFTELLRDGLIDRAVAAARRAVHKRWDWWMPVLYSRLESGRLFADEPQPEPEGRLAAPGGRPAIPAPWTVPFPRNDRLVGREEELGALHRLLGGDGDAAPVGITPAGISGMGGIGKTQLAVEYAYRHRDDYPGGIFWVNAARVQDWAGELVDLADRARLVPADASSPDRTGQMVAALARYLQDHPRSLVIFDNVADPGHLQTVRLGPGIAPAELGGALLFTTRRRDLPPGLATLDVEVLPRAASRRMILAARPEAAGDPALDQLCATLGDLPLALALAAAALRHRPRLSISAYLENLGRLGADTLHDKARVTPGDLATYYAASLTPALEAQWDALQDENACLLLRAAAQLGEAELLPLARLGLLTGLRDDDDGLEEPLGDALRELEANALVEPMEEAKAGTGRRLRLHPLVRDYAARQTEEAERAAFRGSLAANLAAAYKDFSVLEAHCARRGVDALQHDLLTALGLLDQTSGVSENLRSLERDLRALLRLLQREAHNLRGWDAEAGPAFFAQQVCKRATEIGLAGLAGAAEARLARGTAPYLGLQWRVGAESPALERTLTGHEDTVRAVALMPDGRRAVSASDDGMLRVWDLVSGEEVRTLHGHSSTVRAVTVTPDGRRAVSASDDRTLRVWNLDTGRMMATLRGHEDWVLAVAVTPDGQRVISGSADGTLRVWDLKSGEELTILRGHEGGVNAVAVTPDGRRAASVSTDRTLRVWDLSLGQELTLRGHAGFVYGVAVLPDGRRAVSGSSDRVLKVWDLESGRELTATHRHQGVVNAVTVTPCGRRAVSACSDSTVRVWDLDSGRQLAVLRGHEDVVRSVAVTPDGRRAVSASSDRTLRVWDLDLIGEQEALRSHAGAVSAVAVTPDGQRAVSASSDGVLKVWDIESGQEMAVLGGHEDGVLAVTVTPDGHRAVSASSDRTLKVWDLESGTELATLRGHEGGEGGVLAVAVTPDGRRVVSASSDRTLKVWDISSGLNAGLDSGRELITLAGHDDWVRAVAVTPDGRQVVSGSDDGTLRIWDVGSGRELAILPGHAGWVCAVAVTSDGRRAVSASYDGTLRVWDLTNLQPSVELATLMGHAAEVRAVAVTLDGRRALSASDDRTLRVWDISSGLNTGLVTGKSLATLALDGRLACLAVVPGNDDTAGTVRLVAGDAAGNVTCLRYVEPGARSVNHRSTEGR